MTAIPGTILAAPISPGDTAATFPTHHAIYGKGGWHQTANLTTLAAIPSDRLTEGMVCWVISESKLYRWNGSDWVVHYGELPTSGVTAGTYQSVTVNSQGIVTAGSSYRQDGFVEDIHLPRRDFPAITGYMACYAPSVDKIFITKSTANGSMTYIDRVLDREVAFASYAGKDTKAIIYEDSQDKLYIAYGTNVMSVNPSDGSIITSGIACQGKGGFANNKTDNLIYVADSNGGSGQIHRITPSTDAIAGATSLVAGGDSSFPCDDQGICWCSSNNTIYVILQDGKVKPLPCSTHTLGSSIVDTGSTDAAIVYSEEDNRVYACNLSNTNLYVIDPVSNTLIDTVAFPAGYDHAGGGEQMYSFGDFLYIGTQTPTSGNAACMLIYSKNDEEFVGSLSTTHGQLRGTLTCGILEENVFYTGFHGAANASGFLVYRWGRP